MQKRDLQMFHSFLSIMMIRIFGRGCFYSMRSDDVYALQISLTYAETNDIVKFCFELRYRFVCLRCDSLSISRYMLLRKYFYSAHGWKMRSDENEI